MLANTPLTSSAMTAHSAQPHWTPPTQINTSSAMGLPDLTTTTTETSQKEWTYDACITMTLIDESTSVAFWLERTQEVKSVKLEKSVSIPNIIAFSSDMMESIQQNDSSKLNFGKDAMKYLNDASMSIVYPSVLLSGTSHRKHDMYTILNNKYLQLNSSSHKVEMKILLSSLFTYLFELASQTYVTEVGEIARKSSKKKSKRRQGMSFVIPSFASCAYRNILKDAVAHANIPLRNVFGHGIAAVTGALFHRTPSMQKTSFAMEISKLSKNDVIVLFIHASLFHLDVALVQCEGAVNAREISKASVFQRISTLASSGNFLHGNESKSELVECLVGHIKNVLARGGADVILADGSQDIIKEALKTSTLKTPLFTTNETDASYGGCLLSAAELDSSKEYLQAEDGDWYISYLVSTHCSLYSYIICSSYLLETMC